MINLHDKVIIVTGGSGLLGTEIIYQIKKLGAIVINLEINIKTNVELTEIECDITNPKSIKNSISLIIQKHGKIDGLVNGAGGNIPSGVLQPTEDVFNLNIDGMKDALVLNLWGTIIPVQVFGPEIAKTGNGSIVNISSVSSKRAITKVLGYSMGKAAIDIYTKWFAIEMANRYGDKIRINSIMPGFFLTSQNKNLLTNEDGSYTDRGNAIIRNTPYKRFGQPDELIGALVWLLSDASKFVTGMDIGVDGGFTINSGV